MPKKLMYEKDITTYFWANNNADNVSMLICALDSLSCLAL